VIGPMFSGKTTELIRRCRRMMAIGKKVLIIHAKKDNRNGAHAVTTHDGAKLDAKSVDMVTVHWFEQFMHEYQVIAFDEGQFFEGLDEVIKVLMINKKHVIVSALQGDASMHQWDMVSKLIPMADDIIHVKALCVKCHAPASFTKKLVPGGELVDVGGKDKYMACCYKCYNI
jgi:thymidine kinase